MGNFQAFIRAFYLEGENGIESLVFASPLFFLPSLSLSLQSQSFLCSVCRWHTDLEARAASGKESVLQDAYELSLLVSAPLEKK